MLLAPGGTPDGVRRELDTQIEVLHAILEAMGYERTLLAIAADDAALDRAIEAASRPATDPPATFAPSGEKRSDVRLALDHLHEHAPLRPEAADLPPAAPFGQVVADREACTLCMACVSVCPASALQAGGDEPRLSFIEANCVQCGLCERACPESCITRSQRYLFDRESRRRARMLNEDQPFRCVSCGKVFGTTAVVTRMMQRLESHSMFQAPGALDRLRMCEDCRVKDLFRSEGRFGEIDRIRTDGRPAGVRAACIATRVAKSIRRIRRLESGDGEPPENSGPFCRAVRRRSGGSCVNDTGCPGAPFRNFSNVINVLRMFVSGYFRLYHSLTGSGAIAICPYLGFV